MKILALASKRRSPMQAFEKRQTYERNRGRPVNAKKRNCGKASVAGVFWACAGIVCRHFFLSFHSFDDDDDRMLSTTTTTPTSRP